MNRNIEPETMKRIRAIREKLLEETSGMTPEEQAEKERVEVDAFIKKNGIKIRTVSKITR